MNQTFWQFATDIWLSGGYLMIPLFLLATLVFGNCVQLYFYTSRQSLPRASKEELARYALEPQQAPGNYGRILRYVKNSSEDPETLQMRFEEVQLAILAVLERRIQFLKTLVAAAPLMGLLGTVIGMLATFVGLASSGGETVDVVAGGIKEALITTQTGLMIALPGLFVILLVQRRKHTLEAALSKLQSITLATLTSSNTRTA